MVGDNDRGTVSLSRSFLLLALVISTVFVLAVTPSRASAPSGINVSPSTPILGSTNATSPWVQLGPSNYQNPQNIPGSPSQIASGHVGDGIAVYWKNPNIIYLELGTGPGYIGPSSAGGVYKTTNGGKTWNPVDFGLEFGVGDGIILNQSNPNEVLVAVFTGIYKTTDGGAYWYKVSNFQDVSSFRMVGNTVYAASTTGVIMSSDFGNTWTDLTCHLNCPVIWTDSISISGGYIYAVQDYPLVLVRSTNMGQTWQQMHNFTSVADNIWSVNASPTDPNNIYVAVGPTPGNPYLYHSTNGGQTFSPVLLKLSGTSILAGISEVVFDPVNSNILYVAGGAYEAKSTDNGTTWVLGPQGTDNRAIIIDPLNDSLLWLGCDQGIYSSNNGGTTWVSLNAGLSDNLALGLGVGQGGQLALLNMQDYSALITHNGGRSWVGGNEPPIPLGNEGTVVYVNPYNSSYAYGICTCGAVEVSNNGGYTFNYQGFTGAHIVTSTANAIIADPYNTTLVYLAGSKGIYVGSGYGASWALLNGSPGNVTSIGFLGKGGLIVGTPDGAEYFANGVWSASSGIGGGTSDWTNVVTSVAVDPGNTSIVYATTGMTGSGVLYRSEDSGHSFSVINTVIAPRYNSDLQTPLLVFTLPGMGTPSPVIAATLYGIYVSTDMGMTWHSITYNLHDGDVTGVTMISGNLYISTWGEGMLEYPNFSLTNLPATFEGSVNGPGYVITIDNSTVPIYGLHFKEFLTPGTHKLTISYKGYTYTAPITLSPTQDYAVAITYAQPKYSVSFTESGLGAGTTWSATLNGTTLSSNTNTIVFPGISNGTYQWHLSPPVGYNTTSTSGTAVVNGADISEAINFTTLQSCPIPTIDINAPAIKGLSVTVNGAAKPGGMCVITSVSWSWGDSASSSTGWFPATHVYTSSGTYEITATAHQSDGKTAAISTQVTVTSLPATAGSQAFWTLVFIGIAGVAAIGVCIIWLRRHKTGGSKS